MKFFKFLLISFLFLTNTSLAQYGSYAEYNRLSQATQRAFNVPDRYTITTYSSRVVNTPSSTNSSSSSNYKYKHVPASTSDNSWAMPCRTCYQTWGSSYQQSKYYDKINVEDEIRERAKAQEQAVRLLQEQQRLDAEYKRQEAENARLKQAEIERLRQERLNYFKARLLTLKQNPLQTIFTAPVFSNSKQKYDWYFNEANHNTGINDNYAKVIVAQMALDGEGCRKDIITAIKNNNDAVHCSLSLCTAAEISIARNEKDAFNFENIFLLLNAATDYHDNTKGDERAYKKLLNIYTKDSLLGYQLPTTYNNINKVRDYLCVSAKANVYAYAANNGDKSAASDLRYILIRHTNRLKQFPKSRLINIAEAFPLLNEDAYYGLLAWDNLAQKLELVGDTSCFKYYAKCLENNNADKQIVNSMSVALARLSLNNTFFEKKLSIAQQKIILKNANTYANTYDSMVANRGYISNADLMRYFDCFWGNSGVPSNYIKATAVAKEIIKRDENEFAPLQKVALAYRLGNGNWPKDDKIAIELFELASKQILENTDIQKEIKATYYATTADYWKANSQLGLTLNNQQLGYNLEQAAILDNTKAQEFADWVSNKKANYYSKEKAIKYYNKAIVWYQNVQQLYINAQIEDTITPSRINAIKAKIAKL